MSASMAEILEAGRQHAGLSIQQLWLAYYSLGGNATPLAFDGYLAGTELPVAREYDLIAQALNDHFIDAGENHPVPYAEDLT